MLFLRGEKPAPPHLVYKEKEMTDKPELERELKIQLPSHALLSVDGFNKTLPPLRRSSAPRAPNPLSLPILISPVV